MIVHPFDWVETMGWRGSHTSSCSEVIMNKLNLPPNSTNAQVLHKAGVFSVGIFTTQLINYDFANPFGDLFPRPSA